MDRWRPQCAASRKAPAWTKREKRSTASAITSIWRKSALWASRSGWREDTAGLRSWQRPWPPEPLACRWGRPLHSARNRACRDDYKQALLAKAVSGEARVFTDSVASPTNFPFKVARLEGTAFGGRGLFRPAPDLRFGLSAGSLQDAGRDHRLPLLGRAGDRLCFEGRQSWRIRWEGNASAMP